MNLIGGWITMSTQLIEQPVYDERVHEILRGLAMGETREALAKKAGNSNWKSIDMYMRRREFIWNADQQTYIPRVAPVEHETEIDSSKAGNVVRLLAKEGADVRTVAERLGFKDHRELADYMNVKGFNWDAESNNYQKILGEMPRVERALETKTEQDSLTHVHNEMPPIPSKIQAVELNDYLPLLRLLDKHQERLIDLVVPIGQTGTIPRFVVPGVGKTKTVQMMNTIEQLVVDFSKEKNMSQRELFEVALIEFFRRYGYEQEVDRLLNI